jgi:AraC-like DNA-binding protein
MRPRQISSERPAAASAPFAPLRFDSAEFPAADQFAAFTAGLANFDLSREQTGPYAAAARIWRLGALVLTEVEADPVIYDRGAARIRADAIDHYYVNFHVKGGVRADCARGLRPARAGSLLVIDMRQPCRMAADTRQTISLAVPRQLLAPRLEPFDPHGLVAQDGLTALFGRVLQAVCGALPSTPMAHAAALERTILDLLVETLLEALRAAEALSRREEALIIRLRAYLDAHLGEEMDVGAICRGLGVSRSSLYRVCGGGGGVRRLLQQRRLRRLRALLEDPADARPLAALARSAGFRDHAHASRAFKQSYGVTPGAFRAAPLTAAPEGEPPHDRTARLFRSWIRQLS